MAGPRYNQALQEFIRQWRPNDPELDKRFVEGIRGLVEAILKPPAQAFEVSTLLSPIGGKVVLRLADYEAQLSPVEANNLALSLVEGAASARLESFFMKFLGEKLELDMAHAVQVIATFRDYRHEEMQRELDTNLREADAGTP